MSIQLRIAGRPTSPAEASAAVRGDSLSGRREQPDTRLLDAVDVLGAFEMYPKDRAASEKPTMLEAEDDDLIEFVLEDGISVWTSVAAHRERQRRLKPGVQTAKELDIDLVISTPASSRGLVSDIVTGAVRILRLKRDEVWEQAKDPTQWPAWIKPYGVATFEKLGAWLTAKLIIWFIERKIRPEEGLYRWVKPSAEDGPSLIAPGSIPSDAHVLLFIHGTASNTMGSFGALHTDEASSEWDTLTRTFKDHIYAFDHRTLSQSPIDNAVMLANALPDGAQISLVSHSRGGQVADLLCLRELSSEQVNRFHREGDKSRQADEHDRRQLAELAKILRKKKFRIVRLIRVACPAQGTLLASENLDRFLSVLTSLIGLIPVVGQSLIYQVAKRITLEVAKSRWDPSVIPGAESMVPQSPLVALLNAPDVQGGGALGVIAGDIEDVSWFKRLGTFITDRFIYDNQDNDLVVNTNSMFQGVPRSAVSRYIFDQGSDVSHFRYFRNSRTRHLLVQSITNAGEQWPAEFRLLDEAKVAPVPMLRSIQTRSGASQPVVFVLPGIMGSELQANGDDVWLSYLSLFLGHIDKIAVDAPNVEVNGLVSTYYRDLCNYLGDTHEVIPFGYDWRHSITRAASKLADEVKKVVARTGEPIRFIAHSMGGLVVRRLIKDFPDLWETLCKREGARFVMLGTPNRGSYDMVESLAGMAKTVKQLALLDVTHSMSEIVAIVSAYQGALELLPQDEGEYFTSQKWTELHPLTESKVQIKPQILQDAKAALADLPERIPHAECVRYVAGWAPKTVCGVKVENQRLSFQATTAGDGRVTYKAGLLPDIPVWYVDAEHGDLADHKPAFPAYRDLLERGVTNQLSTTPLSADRGGESIFDYEHEPVLYPTASDFEAGLLGKRRKALKVRTSEKLQVSVLHGDLIHTNHPILLGHYQGDTIFGSEQLVDRFLVGNSLSQRYNLGRYPGRTETVAVVLTQPNDVQTAFRIRHGAIVIGLGKWGELTPSVLTQAVHHGVMEYCVQFAQCCGSTEASTISTGLTINSLLIGSNTSANIAVEDSVNAIVRGVILANRALMEQNHAFPRITHVQFIELYLDVAIDAAKTVHRLAKRIERDLQAEIDVATWLKKGIGGRTRYVPSSTRGYWRRWTVSAVHDAPAPAPCILSPVLKDRLRITLQDEKVNDPRVLNALLDLAFKDDGPVRRHPRKLRFLALSDRARAEVIVEETQPELIAQLIQRSITSTAFRRDIAKTLFELLIPLDLKDSLLNQDRVVLVLDDVTANYPWELMIDVDQPLCIRIGMVRQLETADYEERIRDTTATNVYVVGNPLTPSNYPTLPGAQKEAELVASLLKPHYAVNHSSQRLGALEVLNQLFAQPYRIIHIAGHGSYNEAETELSGAKAGVVLDNGLFLTAAEIAKLDPIPELVFLNCCYLGQIGGTAYNKMAASISRELIRKGVRAVVAAGWPVRDDAALCFAQVFYKKLLDSQPFGHALKEARQQTWALFPESNTWGAYQAYGDPDFRLRQNHDVQVDNEDVTVAAEEVLIALDDLEHQSGEPDVATLQNKLDDLKGRCAVDWLKQGNVQEQLGKVYGEHGLFQEAVAHYKKAAESEDIENPATCRGIEQWINLEARLGKKINDKARIKRAIKRGLDLLKIAETSERLSIMGSAYKRLAELDEEPSEITTNLKEAAAYYQKAAERQEQEPLADPYPIMNWLTIEALLETSKVPYESWLSKAEILARQRFQATRKAWDLFAVADIEVLRAIQNKKESIKSAGLVGKYRKVFTESAATQREQDSARSQLEFIITMRQKLSRSRRQKRAVDSIGDALTDIRHHLEKSKPQAKPSPIQPKVTSKPSPTSKAPAKQPLQKSSVQEKKTRRPKRHRKG
ncbi:MAG: CHAT domain-containing protein [Nitrospira sp.]|nr:MAG: CHAT domain-containing protein [Nitrospira sp.]